VYCWRIINSVPNIGFKDPSKETQDKIYVRVRENKAVQFMTVLFISLALPLVIINCCIAKYVCCVTVYIG